jgi:hypothetical protein
MTYPKVIVFADSHRMSLQRTDDANYDSTAGVSGRKGFMDVSESVFFLFFMPVLSCVLLNVAKPTAAGEVVVFVQGSQLNRSPRAGGRMAVTVRSVALLAK